MLLRFADFEFDPESCQLLKNGLRVPIQEKPCRVLVMLLDRPGQLVTRKQVFEQIWAGTYVSEDQSLNTAIRKVRLALNDSPDSPRFIETVGSRGYRFIHPVEPAEHGNGASAPRVLTVAVMPLENLGSESDEHLSLGLTETMIAQLSRLQPNVSVIGMPSALRFRNRETKVQEIATQLGADFVLSGSIRRSGERIRVTRRLIDGGDQTCLWSQTFDGDLSDTVAIQNEIAEKVAASTARLLAPGTTVPRTTSTAHEIYLRGRFFWNKRTAQGLLKSIELFNQALAEDPNYPLTYVGLADAYVMLVQHGIHSGDKAYPLARQAALKALELDSRNIEAHVSLAWIKCVYERDCDAAEIECQTALQLNPSYSFAYMAYGFLLTTHGRHQESLEFLRRGLQVDPVSLPMNGIYASALYFARQYTAAIEQCKECIDLDPAFAMPYAIYGQALEGRDLLLQATEKLRTFGELAPGNPIALALLGRIFALRGMRDQALQYLHKLLAGAETTFTPPYVVAQLYAALGDHDSAFNYLEQADQQRSNWVMFLGVDPKFDSLRSDPRFSTVLQNLGVSSWQGC